MQVLADLAKDPVFQIAGMAMKHKQTGRITRLDRCLCDGGFGKVIVEIRGLHRQISMKKIH